jgi:hypothetical protein
LNTIMRYIHLNDADVLAAMEKFQGRHKNGTLPIRRFLSNVKNQL